MSTPPNRRSYLASLLRLDVVDFLVSLARFGRAPEGAERLEVYPNPAALREAIKSGVCADGDVVRVRSRPSGFGPYLRRHILPMLSGNFSGNRLGPPIVALDQNPVWQAMGMMANMAGLLVPVGLYPSLSSGVVQGALYPPDARTLGLPPTLR